MADALKVVGDAAERRDAQELAAAMTAFHESVHELKQLAVVLERAFARLDGSQRTLAEHDVAVEPKFEPHVQVSLDHWRSRR